MSRTRSQPSLLEALRKKTRSPTWLALAWKIGVHETQLSKWLKGQKMSKLRRAALERMLEDA